MIAPWPVVFLCGVYMFSLHMYSFTLHSGFSHRWKKTTLKGSRQVWDAHQNSATIMRKRTSSSCLTWEKLEPQQLLERTKARKIWTSGRFIHLYSLSPTKGLRWRGSTAINSWDCRLHWTWAGLHTTATVNPPSNCYYSSSCSGKLTRASALSPRSKDW